MKTIQHGLRLFAAGLVLLMIAHPLLAEEKPVGLVVALRGEVAALNTVGGQRRLAVKSEIYLADTIQTGRRGRVQMMFADNTLISLGPNSDLQIAEYHWNPDKKNGAMKTRVSEGVFRIMGGAITQVAPDNFKTETPAGTIGIRGSMYAGKVAGSSLQVLFQGGKGIYVTNDAGTVSIDRTGYGTFVAGPQTPPTAPARFSGEDLAFLDDAGAVSTQSPDQGDETGNGTESQSSSGASGQPEGDEDQPTIQEQWTPETTDAQTVEEETPLLSGAAAIAVLQSTASATPVDTVKDVVNAAVADSIQTVRQEEVTEIEQAILDLLLEMGFAEARSTSVPGNGIEGFDGVVRHKPLDTPDYSESTVKLMINWYNQKFFAVAEDPATTDKQFPVFIFGDVNGTALDNLQVVGSNFDVAVNRVSAIKGTGTFGQLYGPDTDAAGFAMEGVDVNVQNQSDRTGWTAYAAVLSKDNPPPATVPGGTHNLTGFVLGVAEDMAAPDVNRRIFMNSQAANFRLNVNKDSGTVSGNLSAGDFYGSGSAITNLQIGGSLPSAYVLDDAMIALMGGGSITTAGSSGGLKAYGNYLITEKQPEQLAPYTTWGYWEIAYRDPAFGIDYHVHQPGSIWIAGPQTPAAEVSNLMATNFVGTYTGGAEGIRIDPGGWISELTGGATSLTVDFNPAAAQPLAGTISFDQVNLNVISSAGAVNTGGFNAQIGGAAGSTVKGAFFGPNAAAIGGNFGARMGGGDEYYGVFGGSR